MQGDFAVDGGVSLDIFEPDKWYVAFFDRSDTYLVNWVAIGRFKHVMAFTWSQSGDCWLFYDTYTYKQQILLVPDSDFHEVFMRLAGHSVAIVEYPGLVGHPERRKITIGGNCVSAVSRLLGLGTCALRPYGLYRHLLANGGSLLEMKDENGKAGRIEGSQASTDFGEK